MSDQELRETYPCITVYTFWFLNHVDLFKTLNLIKNIKRKNNVHGIQRKKGEAMEKDISDKRYHEVIAFMEKVRGEVERHFSSHAQE